jgi:hypothetical protein
LKGGIFLGFPWNRGKKSFWEENDLTASSFAKTLRRTRITPIFADWFSDKANTGVATKEHKEHKQPFYSS